MEAHPQVTFLAHGRQLPQLHTAQSDTAAALLRSALAAAHVPSWTSSSAGRVTLKNDAGTMIVHNGVRIQGIKSSSMS